MSALRGIDVSQIQGDVDWRAVAAQGISFVYCRAGVGNDGKDRDFDADVRGASEVGLTVGAYDFVYPLPTAGNPTRDPKAEALAHFHASGGLGMHAGELVPAVDLEWPPQQDWNKWGCTAAQIREWGLEYLAECESLWGLRPIIYTYPDFWRSIGGATEPRFASYPLWLASYPSALPTPDSDFPEPFPPWDHVSIWQTSGGSQHLSNGVPVDTDLMRGEDLPALTRGALAAA